MRRHSTSRSLALGRASTLALLVLLIAVPTSAKDKGKGKDKGESTVQGPNDCTKVQAHAQYQGIGYTHIVTLNNGCTQAVECTLWSDVDPEPRTTVRAAPGASAEVVTRRGSPSRAVTGFKLCSFR